MSLKDYHELIINFRREDISYKEIAEKLGFKRDTIKHYCQKNNIRGKPIDNSLETRENKFIEIFNKMFPDFEYISGYKTYDSTIKVKCKICGHVQERNAHTRSNMQCDNCVEVARLEEIKAKEVEKANRARKENEYTETKCAECGKIFLRTGNAQKYCSNDCRDKANKINQIHIKVCIECGAKFETNHNGNIYCSDKCRLKKARRKKYLSRDQRITMNGKADYSISLARLIKRDDNRCHICGEICNTDDYIITDEGYFLAGNDYPSIDHVQPLSKGGMHAWDNVRLAHRRCNSLKSNKIFWDGESEQQNIAI